MAAVASRCTSGRTWPYVSNVTAIRLCPSISETTFAGTFFL